MKYIVHDIETYPNIFSFCGYIPDLDSWYVYEISDRKNERNELLNFLNWASNEGYYFVGYNNIGFDYEFLHVLLNSPHTFTYQKAAELCQEIIRFRPEGEKRWSVRFSDRLLKQIDLYTINHFNNKARATSLKALQCAMRAESVEDLPYDIRPLNDQEKDVLLAYNYHDVLETYNFLKKNLHLIEMRKNLLESGILDGDVLNYSDVKIGSEFLIKQIGREKCYDQGKLKQTVRYSVPLKDVILPKIYFINEEYEAVSDWFKTITWYMDRENSIKLETNIKDFTFHFGLGGLHASVDNKTFKTNDEWTIVDLDVASLYPSISIANDFYPEHLGQIFTQKYKDLKAQRFLHAKGTALNAMFKLALNGAFGNSNNAYSPFYDPKYMLSITINGQLQILQLAERLFSVPNVIPIQVNTDGITCYVKNDSRDWFNLYRDHWQIETGLELEEVEYSRMYIRDVNNYVAVTKSGKVKTKGAYWYPETEKDYDGYWNKDYSSMVVQKAIRHVLFDGVNPDYIVRLFTDKFDFMLKYKTPHGAAIFLGDKKCSKTVRYYVSTKGQPMIKRATPKGEMGAWKRKNSLSDDYFNKIMGEIPKGSWDARIHTANKTKYDTVETNIESGKLVKLCNKASDFDWNDVNFDYYANEIRKLII